MKHKTLPPTPPADAPREQVIEPVAFRPSHYRHQPKLSSWLKKLIWITLGIIFSFLSYSTWFVFTSRQVVIQIDPEPERISIKGGFLTPRFGNYHLLRPGNYILKALKQGYHRIKQPFKVSDEKSQKLTIVMEKLPGRLTLTAHKKDQPSVGIEGATVFLDGKDIGVTPLPAIEVKPGLRQLVIKADSYQDLETQLNIEGMGILQSFDFLLVPGWAEIKINALPHGANVYVDGIHMGETPLVLSLSAGTHEIKISAESFKTWHTQLKVEPGKPHIFDRIQLEPADGTLVLQTKPPGANVTVGETFVGQTPIEISLQPDTDHLVRVSKAGYEKVERRVTVTSAGIKKLDLELVSRKGILHLTVIPEGAELFIDGKSLGTVPQSLSLIAIAHRLKIVKDGYEPYQTKITPRPGFPQELKVSLKKKMSSRETTPGIIEAFNGYPLTLIHPTSFTMGSSRREQGRRSNETLRKVILKQPFYMGVREVTNREFRQYLAGHNSGVFKGNSLNREKQPALQVSWEQAALFCNWLSEKEKLPPVYMKRKGKLLPREPFPTGYRLPTEAEWEYCVRFAQNKVSLIYPWGDTFPPKSKTLNIADISAKDLLSAYLEKYNDGYPVTAPPASFKANALGLYDLGGNVAEWCSDYYSIYSFSPTAIYQDPSGPQDGKHHVVRGSSWKNASISVLRASYRDYSNDKRIDLGFRICRYADYPYEKK